VLRLVGGRNGPLPRQLFLSDFGRVTKGRFAVANPPHNAPMFRRVACRLWLAAQVRAHALYIELIDAGASSPHPSTELAADAPRCRRMRIAR
jgi:hypothetical protein